jgi:DNA-directed RNA polymerase subunit RPC12/RpoP
MPIRFRCNRCSLLLGIARRKAGTETRCPHCGATLLVPKDEDGGDEPAKLDDIDNVINPASMEPQQVAVPAMASRPVQSPMPLPPQAAIPIVPRPAPPLPTAQSPPRAAPKPVPHATPDGERPLFERDVDAVLGVVNKEPPGAEPARPKQAATGMDALSLAPEQNQIVLSSQKATALVVVVVVLLALSFAAGFLIASR